MRKILLSLLLVVAMLMPVGLSTSPAAADTAGCAGRYKLKADNWVKDTYYTNFASRLPDTRKIRLVATAGYWFCPNGTGVNKVKVKWVDFCYTHLENRAAIFDGVKFNPYFFDDNTDSNPPTTKVPNDYTVQNCKRYDITTEKWLRMSQSPGWTVTSWIVLDLFPDEERVFRWGGSRIKYFHPQDDVSLTGWL